jgi:hypothetical protein
VSASNLQPCFRRLAAEWIRTNMDNSFCLVRFSDEVTGPLWFSQHNSSIINTFPTDGSVGIVKAVGETSVSAWWRSSQLLRSGVATGVLENRKMHWLCHTCPKVRAPSGMHEQCVHVNGIECPIPSISESSDSEDDVKQEGNEFPLGRRKKDFTKHCDVSSSNTLTANCQRVCVCVCVSTAQI